jgi:O-6-methylguanine DNA methyltransferase
LASESVFTRRVIAVVRRVPVGRVTTYGTVARLAGKPRAARAVGNIMAEARYPGLPYHRVIAANGQLGGYGGNIGLKRALLIAEGLTVGRTRVRNFAKVQWPPVTNTPRRHEGTKKNKKR